jgi:hypothetical protein
MAEVPNQHWTPESEDDVEGHIFRTDRDKVPVSFQSEDGETKDEDGRPQPPDLYAL